MRALIIEDEENSRLSLQNMIEKFCTGVTIVDAVASVPEGVRAINLHQPELIFLDIEFPRENGFAIFDYFLEPTFEVIFTTAYDDYALKAIKRSAVDYLLKPIDLEDLQKALEKAKSKKVLERSHDRLSILKGNLNNKFQKLALPINDGYFFVELDDITRCEALGNYTVFYLRNLEKVIVCRTLGIYDDILSELSFIRINRSHLINLKYIQKFSRKKSPTVTMTDGAVLSVSQGRKNDFLNAIENAI